MPTSLPTLLQRLAVGSVVALLLAAGCAPVTTARAETASRTAEAVAAVEAPPAEPCSGPAVDGCYDLSQMDVFFEQLKNMVREFFDATYIRMPHPKLEFIRVDWAGLESCIKQDGSGGRQPSTDRSFGYCALDRKIYTGQNALWSYYEIDDKAALFTLAHEWTHHAQAEAGIIKDLDTPSKVLAVEKQADCGGGAMISYGVKRGWVDETDLTHIPKLMEGLGEPNTPLRQHGTVDERTEAFYAGFNGGMFACNKYVPKMPLITRK